MVLSFALLVGLLALGSAIENYPDTVALPATVHSVRAVTCEFMFRFYLAGYSANGSLSFIKIHATTLDLAMYPQSKSPSFIGAVKEVIYVDKAPRWAYFYTTDTVHLLDVRSMQLVSQLRLPMTANDRLHDAAAWQGGGQFFTSTNALFFVITDDNGIMTVKNYVQYEVPTIGQYLAVDYFQYMRVLIGGSIDHVTSTGSVFDISFQDFLKAPFGSVYPTPKDHAHASMFAVSDFDTTSVYWDSAMKLVVATANDGEHVAMLGDNFESQKQLNQVTSDFFTSDWMYNIRYYMSASGELVWFRAEKQLGQDRIIPAEGRVLLLHSVAPVRIMTAYALAGQPITVKMYAVPRGI